MSVRPSVTQWGRVEEMIPSQYGQVTYQKWCILECERMNRRGDHTHIVSKLENGFEFVAITRGRK